jgi:hypothetical protein
MENNNDQKPEVVEEVTPVQEKIVARLAAQRAVKELSNGDSPWNLTQEILQEIHAAHIVANPDKAAPVTEMVEELKREIEVRYADNEETRNLILASIPSVQNVRGWLKKEGWEEAVWKRVRGDSLFSPEKRAQVIESLRQRAVDPKRPSDTAAKIWLTLSGDYSEKMEVTDKSLDAYREINSVLHGNRKSRE